jgi:hypothetical protein
MLKDLAHEHKQSKNTKEKQKKLMSYFQWRGQGKSGSDKPVVNHSREESKVNNNENQMSLSNFIEDNIIGSRRVRRNARNPADPVSEFDPLLPVDPRLYPR